MKQEFIRQNHLSKLILFFTGWGIDARTHSNLLSRHYDIAVCSRYTDLRFESQPYRDYSEIVLIAWSMGVWVAAQVLSDTTLPLTLRLAVNGTRFPIDDEKGIPVSVFDGTRKNLNDRTLEKFRKRMCGSAKQYEAFVSMNPHRSCTDLAGELTELARQYQRLGSPAFDYDRALVGENDRIFPAANQLNGWNPEQTVLYRTNDAHYLDFNKIIDQIDPNE